MQKIIRHEFSQDKTVRLGTHNGVSGSTEMLEERGGIELINDMARRSNSKNGRFLLLLMLVPVILYSYTELGAATSGACIPKLRKKATVLNYIQNQDGKK